MLRLYYLLSSESLNNIPSSGGRGPPLHTHHHTLHRSQVWPPVTSRRLTDLRRKQIFVWQSRAEQTEGREDERSVMTTPWPGGAAVGGRILPGITNKLEYNWNNPLSTAWSRICQKIVTSQHYYRQPDTRLGYGWVLKTNLISNKPECRILLRLIVIDCANISLVSECL